MNALETEKSIAQGFLHPILSNFVEWIHDRLEENQIRNVLFLSREGVLIKQFFDKKYKDKFNSVHLEISRRSITVPNIRNESDIKKLIYNKSTRFMMLDEMLLYRFGLKVALAKNYNLAFLKKEECFELVKPYINDILNNAEIERSNFTNYLKKTNSLNSNCAVIDLGYNGSIQSQLKLLSHYEDLGMTIKGFYLATFIGITKNLNKNEYDSFLFREIDKDKELNLSFFTSNTVLLEYIFSSGSSSVEKYDIQGNAVYYEHERKIEKRDSIHQYAVTYQNDAYFSRLELTKMMQDFILNPHGDVCYFFSNIDIDDRFGGNATRYIICQKRSIFMLNYLQSEWKVGYKKTSIFRNFDYIWALLEKYEELDYRFFFYRKKVYRKFNKLLPKSFLY